MPIGQALQNARHEIRKKYPWSLIWASYICYGDPLSSPLEIRKRLKKKHQYVLGTTTVFLALLAVISSYYWQTKKKQDIQSQKIIEVLNNDQQVSTEVENQLIVVNRLGPLYEAEKYEQAQVLADSILKNPGNLKKEVLDATREIKIRSEIKTNPDKVWDSNVEIMIRLDKIGDLYNKGHYKEAIDHCNEILKNPGKNVSDLEYEPMVFSTMSASYEKRGNSSYAEKYHKMQIEYLEKKELRQKN
jgi:hypothetical protein